MEKMRGMPNFQLPICFHVHQATERYQQAGLKIDGFAERTERYNEFDGALTTMFQDAGFTFPDGGVSQLTLPIPGA